METPITKHPEFKAKQQKFIDKVPNHIGESGEGNAFDYIRGAHKAGGEAAQAILQPEINRLREINEKLLAACKTAIQNIPDYYSDYDVLRQAIELAEGPNK